MSVQSNTYVMVGVMLPFDHFNEEQHEALDGYCDSAYKGIHHTNGLCAIVDGMNGEYVAIGRVLAKTDDQNGNYGFNKPVDCAPTRAMVREVKQLLEELFSVTDPDVKCWAFTHYR